MVPAHRPFGLGKRARRRRDAAAAQHRVACRRVVVERSRIGEIHVVGVPHQIDELVLGHREVESGDEDRAGGLPFLREADRGERVVHQMRAVVARHVPLEILRAAPVGRVEPVEVVDDRRHPGAPHWHACATAVAAEDKRVVGGDRDVVDVVALRHLGGLAFNGGLVEDDAVMDPHAARHLARALVARLARANLGGLRTYAPTLPMRA